MGDELELGPHKRHRKHRGRRSGIGRSKDGGPQELVNSEFAWVNPTISQIEQRFDLLTKAIKKLDNYLSMNDWKLIDRELEDLLWRLAEHKIDRLKDGRIRPKPEYRHRRHSLRMKENARALVGQAVANGTLVKPLQCEHCGSRTMLHGHHEDYSKPLDVIWLCVPCHAEEHKGERYAAFLIMNSKPLPRWGDQ